LAKANYILSGTMIFFALSIFYMSRQLTEDAAGWPGFFAYLLIFLSIGLIIETIYKSKKAETDENGQKKQQSIDLIEKNLVYTVVLSIAYLFIMEHIGFLIVTPIYLAILMWLLQYRSIKSLLSVSIGATVIIVLIFQYLLGVPIPQGILENIM